MDCERYRRSAVAISSPRRGSAFLSARLLRPIYQPGRSADFIGGLAVNFPAGRARNSVLVARGGDYAANCQLETRLRDMLITAERNSGVATLSRAFAETD